MMLVLMADDLNVGVIAMIQNVSTMIIDVHIVKVKIVLVDHL